MSNLVDIQNQIQKLQKQAGEIKAREFDKTVQEILTKMQAFGITLKDLRSRAGRGGKAKSAGVATKSIRTRAALKNKSATVVAPKYRGPNGETWSGRGLTPRWLASLVAQGRAKEDFAIRS
jgi:DNA-binding protein H-NS